MGTSICRRSSVAGAEAFAGTVALIGAVRKGENVIMESVFASALESTLESTFASAFQTASESPPAFTSAPTIYMQTRDVLVQLKVMQQSKQTSKGK